MPTWSLIDNALSGMEFNEESGKKPQWYDDVFLNQERWESAWTGGSFFPLKCDGISVTLENKKVSIAITQPDTGMWYEAIIVLDLSLKRDFYDSLQKRFFFMWTYLSLRFCKLLKIKSPVHSEKVGKKDPLSKKVRKK